MKLLWKIGLGIYILTGVVVSILALVDFNRAMAGLPPVFKMKEAFMADGGTKVRMGVFYDVYIWHSMMPLRGPTDTMRYTTGVSIEMTWGSLLVLPLVAQRSHLVDGK
jgi:hypothetical protein